MAQVTRSLRNVPVEHALFEQDQVLTSDQLNSVVTYLDRQERLTRLRLLGAGVMSGLEVRTVAGGVELSPGVGITSDGDLLHVASRATYVAWRAYPASAPSYEPLAGLAVYELLTATGPDTTPLAQFSAPDRALQAMTAVLVVTSHARDRDACSSAHCDNLGGQVRHELKLLLIPSADADPLLARVATPDAAARALPELGAARPRLAGITTADGFFAAYAAASKPMVVALLEQLKRLDADCGAFIGGVFTRARQLQLAADLAAIAASPGRACQYVYDLLCDLVETCNDLRARLIDHARVDFVDPDAFAKHLLLGDLTNAARPAHRTGFYPVWRGSAVDDPIEHARFLAAKIAALIAAFKPKVDGSSLVRVTPSRDERGSLEERAIPCYYDPATALDAWSYPLSRRGHAKRNHSYHRAAYGAVGPAAAPLTHVLGRFDLLRVEGHLGKPVTDVVTQLKNEFKDAGLPVALRAVALGPDRKAVIIQPPRPTSGLDELDRVVRRGLAERIDAAVAFVPRLEALANSDQTRATLADQVATDRLKSEVSSGKYAMQAPAQDSAAALRKPRRELADGSWRDRLASTVDAVGALQRSVGEVVKGEVASPISALLEDPLLGWVERIDVELRERDAEAADRLLFDRFLADHPGAEHRAGVVRGGTFIVVYDAAGVVVGDLMLPYFCPEPVEEAATEVVIERPPSKVKIALGKLRDEASKVVSTAGIKARKDELLEAMLLEQEGQARMADAWRRELLAAQQSPAAEATLKERLKRAEGALAQSVERVTSYIAEARLDVTEGREGFVGMAAAAAALRKIGDPELRTQAGNKLKTLDNEAAPPALRNVVKRIVAGG